MEKEVVENAGVQDRNLILLQFLEELVAFDNLAILLIRREVELELRGVEFERAVDDMLFDLPAVALPVLRHAVAREVDDVLHDLHDARAAQDRKDLCGHIACTQLRNIRRIVSRATKSHFEITGRTNIEHEIAHGCLPLCDGVPLNNVASMPAGF